MALYEITPDNLKRITQTTFDQANLRERADLQRLLKRQIDVILPDTLIIAEEFGEWEESKRRIDLLGLDKDANLVVIELKRTEDGGHMELQAIRYAAMVSMMTFERVVDIFSRYLARERDSSDARTTILDFLGWEEPDEDSFAFDVRIVLASSNFSKELTTAVMWLNKRDLDIRCIRIIPYHDDSRILIDVQQVIPLPEAAEYQIQIREKESQERREKAERHLFRHNFWQNLLKLGENKHPLHARMSPSERTTIGASSGVSGMNYYYSALKHENRVEIYIDRPDKDAYDELFAQKEAIEGSFGEPLIWHRLDEKRACRISSVNEAGGYRSPESEWEEIQLRMIEAMTKFEKTFRSFINALD